MGLGCVLWVLYLRNLDVVQLLKNGNEETASVLQMWVDTDAVFERDALLFRRWHRRETSGSDLGGELAFWLLGLVLGPCLLVCLPVGEHMSSLLSCSGY